MMTYFFAALAGLIHVYIWAMESLLWGKPRTNKAFGISPKVAEQNRVAGITLICFSMASMLGAGIILFVSQRKLLRAALIQGLPPLLALIGLAL